MNRERRVIIEEIKMYNENPVMHVEELLEQTMFDGSPLGWDIAGDAKRMLSMTRKDVIAYRDQHYIPSRMVIGLAGKVDKKALALVKKTFGSVKGKHKPVAFEAFHAAKNQVLRCRIENKNLNRFSWHLDFHPTAWRINAIPLSRSSRRFLAARCRLDSSSRYVSEKDCAITCGLRMERTMTWARS